VIGTLALVGIFVPTTTHSEIGYAVQVIKTPLESLSETPTAEQIKSAIVYIADNMGLNRTQMYQTLVCESNLKYNAVGDNGRAFGVAQFHKATWDLFNKKRGTHLNYYSTKDQILMMGWAFKNDLQRNWSCWKYYFSS
jgi:hypothetical protein